MSRPGSVWRLAGPMPNTQLHSISAQKTAVSSSPMMTITRRVRGDTAATSSSNPTCAPRRSARPAPSTKNHTSSMRAAASTNEIEKLKT